MCGQLTGNQFMLGLACVGRDEVSILPLAGAEIGANHTTGVALRLVRKDRCSRPDVGLEVPVDGRDRQARCRAALAPVTFRVAAVVRGDLVIRPALGHCCQRLVGRVRRRAAWGLEGQERLVDRLTCAWPGMVARGRGALRGRLGRHSQPTLGPRVVTQLKTLRAGGVIKTRPTV